MNASDWIFLAVGLWIYFLPTTAAMIFRHRQSTAIFVLNLLAGWTGFGWIAAVVWACIEQKA